jgi:hydrogenase expression/formation protein HypC
MCIAIPAEIVSVEGYEGVVDMAGVQVRASLMLTPEAKVGDYVLVHTGYAINVIDKEAAEETLKLLEEMSALP